MRRRLLLVFLLAVIVRLTYLWFVYEETASLLSGDSPTYINMAVAMAESAEAVPSIAERLPGYPAFLALCRIAAGEDFIVVAVILQALVDALTCAALVLLGDQLRRGLGLAAGILAAFNLNQIVHAGQILTDSLALFLLVAFLLAGCRFLARPSAPRAAVAGLLLGVAIMVRSAAMYLPPLLAAAALPPAPWTARLRRATVALAACLAVLVPWIVHNGLSHGHYRMVSQGGTHLAYWLVPLAREYGQGIPSATTQAEMRAAVAEAMAGRVEGVDPFADAQVLSAVALAKFREMPVSAMARAWAVGTAINLVSPTILSSPPVVKLPRPSFFATTGDGIAAKVGNYLSSSTDHRFVAIVATGLGVSALQMIGSLWGAWLVWRTRGWPLAATLFLACVAVYFALVTGPITGVKYRLPLEPLLTLLLAEAMARLAMALAPRRRWS